MKFGVNEDVIKLLEYMNGGKPTKDGKGHRPAEMGDARDLPIGEVKTRLASVESPRDLHEYLVSVGAFQIRLRVQCPECTRRSWFDLESIRQTFKCPKCLNTFEAIGHVDDGC